jgi:hypothetical protein
MINGFRAPTRSRVKAWRGEQEKPGAVEEGSGENFRVEVRSAIENVGAKGVSVRTARRPREDARSVTKRPLGTPATCARSPQTTPPTAHPTPSPDHAPRRYRAFCSHRLPYLRFCALAGRTVACSLRLPRCSNSTTTRHLMAASAHAPASVTLRRYGSEGQVHGGLIGPPA